MSQDQYDTEVMSELEIQMRKEYEYAKGQGFIDWLYENHAIGNGTMLINLIERGDLQEQYIEEKGLPEDIELDY